MAREFVAFDLETTGMDPRRDEIIEVGGVCFDEDGKVLAEIDLLVQPKGEVPEAVLRLTGIPRAELAQAATWEEVRERVQEFIGDRPLVGHSIGFDSGFLTAKGVRVSDEWYDTWYLSSALFSEPEIYSLEALAQHFGIELDNAHRALADCHASRELFLYCCRELSELDQSVLEGLAALGRKSPYPIDRLVENLPKGVEVPHPSEPNELLRKGATQDLSSFLSVDASKECVLQLVRPEVDILASVSQGITDAERFTVATPNSAERDALMIELQDRGMMAELLLQPGDIISESRLETFLAQRGFSLTEAVFASKLVIWNGRTENGFREELALGGEEYDLWRELSCAELREDELHGERWWSAYREKSEKAVALLCSFRSLPKIELPDRVPLLILNWQVFEEQMTQYLSDHLSSWSRADEAEKSRDRMDIVWGMLGMLAAKFIKEFGESTLVLSPTVTSTPEWNNIRQALENMDEMQGEDSRSRTRAARMREILFSSLKEWIVWIQADQGGVSIHRAPMGVEVFLGELSKERQLLMVGTDATRVPTGCEVLEAPELTETKQTEAVVMKDAPGANSPQLTGFVREVALGLLKSSPDLRLFIAFSSKSSAAEFATQCGGELEGRALIGDGVTGSLNRTKLLLAQDPTAIVLGSPRTNREHLFVRQFDTVIVPKLSFDVPSDPVHAARSKRYGGFQGYSLPRVAGKVRQLIAKLDPVGRRRLVLCDARITGSDWGKTLLAALDLGETLSDTAGLNTVVEPPDS